MAKILILDDVLDAVILMQKILTRCGHSVAVFTNEDEALRYAADNLLDLVILDIKLKKMSGIQVLRQLKQENPNLRAIILTGYPSNETSREALELGASAYCTKPIDKKDLESKVAAALAR